MRHRARSSGFLLVLALAGCGGEERSAAPAGRAAAARQRPHGRGEVRAEMRGVDFRIDPEVVLEVRRLSGALEPTREGASPWFDAPSSFAVRIDEAEIAMTPASLSALMNHYLFAGREAPVADVEIEIRDGHLVQSSTLRKKVPIHATLEGDLSATPGGGPPLPPDEDRGRGAAGQDVARPARRRDLRADRVAGRARAPGGRERPHPRPRATAAAAAHQGPGERGADRAGPHRPGLRRASVPRLAVAAAPRRGALHVLPRRRAALRPAHHARCRATDRRRRPKDPFDFFLARYDRQLVAGYSRTMPDKDLVVYMPDSDETGRTLTPEPR